MRWKMTSQSHPETPHVFGSLTFNITSLHLRPQEGQQVGVELLLVRESQAVGRARIDLQDRALDELVLEQARVGVWHDLVVVALDDQGRNVELLEVFRLVRLGESLDAVEC